MASIDASSEYFKGKHFDLVVEIGTRFGESTIRLLESCNIKKLVTIDPFLQYKDFKHDSAWQIATDETYEKTKQLLSKYENLELVRKLSSDAVEIFEDESIDFIFIDGNHSYEYVTKDLEDYYPKVKTRGILCGDDYFMNASDYGGRKMVQEAVNDFAMKNSLELHTQGTHRGYPKNWVMIKK